MPPTRKRRKLPFSYVASHFPLESSRVFKLFPLKSALVFLHFRGLILGSSRTACKKSCFFTPWDHLIAINCSFARIRPRAGTATRRMEVQWLPGTATSQWGYFTSVRPQGFLPEAKAYRSMACSSVCVSSFHLASRALCWAIDVTYG